MKQFKLANEPIMFALSIHFNNLFAYFHPKNTDMCDNQDKFYSAYPHQILDEIKLLMYNEEYLKEYLTMRHTSPIEFRCAQLIKHYGESYIATWIDLMYGEKTNEVG